MDPQYLHEFVFWLMISTCLEIRIYLNRHWIPWYFCEYVLESLIFKRICIGIHDIYMNMHGIHNTNLLRSGVKDSYENTYWKPWHLCEYVLKSMILTSENVLESMILWIPCFIHLYLNECVMVKCSFYLAYNFVITKQSNRK